MPKVSLILPIYNVEAYISECMESLVNQTLKDIEIICINDASPDGSWDIVQKYAVEDNRFVLISLPENHGQGYARNKGLEAAAGECIMFVDPDDWLELNACELAYNQIKENNNDFVWFGMSLYYENTHKQVKDTLRLSGLTKYIGQNNIKLSELNHPFLKTGEVWNKIYKRSLIEQHHIRFGEGRMCEDIVFLAKFLVYLNNMSVLNEHLYNYRIHNVSSVTLGIKRLNEFWQNKTAGLDIILSQASPAVLKAYIIWHIGSMLYWYNKYSSADKKIAKSFYKEMRKSFILISNQYDINEIKPYIKYSKFKRIVKYSWFGQKVRKLLKQLFSIKKSNNQRHKVITILGIKFKINREKQKMARIKRNYSRNLSYLRRQVKKRKITIAFLVNEISKWKYQSLYELFEKSEIFSPYIALTLADKQQNFPKELQKKLLQENFDYFTEKAIPCIYVWDIENGAQNIETDILFYQQPWSIDKKQFPSHVSRNTLTFYVPYFVPNYGILKMDYHDFHKFLYKYYVLNHGWEKIYKEYAPLYANNVYSVGHPQLDNYITSQIKKEHDYVIYAPHWSVCHPKNKQPENYSTFLKNGKEILEYAKQHTEIEWVFKPHPTLKRTLAKIGWSEPEITAYYKEWEKFAKCCYDADYVELFLQSKAMITDCGSFLIEYFVTGKPLIHLISDDCKETPLEPSKVIFDTFYKAKTLDEMYRHFQDVIIDNKDYLKETRRLVLEESGLKGNNAAQNIYNDLLALLEVA